MLYPFTANIKCELTGADLLIDYECKVEVEDDLTIGGVFDGDANLWLGDDLARSMAARISEQASDDIKARGRLWRRVMDELTDGYVPASASRADFLNDMRKETVL